MNVFAVLTEKLRSLFSPKKKTEDIVEGTTSGRAIRVSERTLTPDVPFYNLRKVLRHARLQFASFEALRPLCASLKEIEDDSGDPLLLVIMGQFKTGKSTFINSILGQQLLTMDVTPATAAVTRLSYGEEEKLIAHFHDRSCKEYPMDWLVRISAEGDPKGEAIRSELSYLEVQIPLFLLKHVNIVDTPGLNSTNLLHTLATKNFISRADAVIWVFSVTQAGTASELSDICTLPADCQPLAVVNQIDTLDPEEDDIDEVLKQISRKLGDIVTTPLGISARQALIAQENDDKELLQKSGWIQYMKLFDTQIIQKSHWKKVQRLRIRVRECLEHINQTVSEAYQEYQEASKWISQYDMNQKAVEQRINMLHSLQMRWRSPGNYMTASTYIWNASPIPNYVENATQLNSQCERLKGVLQEIESQRRRIDTRLQEHNSRLVDFQKKCDKHNADAEKYNTSSIFGGPPIFGPLFDEGWGERINQRIAALEQEGVGLDQDAERINSDMRAHQARVGRAEQENIRFMHDLYQQIELTISNLHRQLKDKRGQIEKAKQKMRILYWSVKAISLLKDDIEPAIWDSIVEYEIIINESEGLGVSV